MRRPRCSRVVADGGALAAFDLWFRSNPYESAFVVTSIKATCSDLLAQARERGQAAEVASIVPIEGVIEGEESFAPISDEEAAKKAWLDKLDAPEWGPNVRQRELRSVSTTTTESMSMSMMMIMMMNDER